MPDEESAKKEADLNAQILEKDEKLAKLSNQTKEREGRLVELSQRAKDNELVIASLGKQMEEKEVKVRHRGNTLFFFGRAVTSTTLQNDEFKISLDCSSSRSLNLTI